MNTSRDIEKLFDHFGGNAGDYQEIGRENEARSARTRWPLLATLDFAQPAIPEIAPPREAQPNAARPRANEASGEAADAHSTPTPTPIHRGKQQLFTRPHRRTIPPVNPPAAESLSALRFSVMGESASNETGTIPDSAVAPAASVPAVQTPVANEAAASKPDTTRPSATLGANFLARRAPVQVPPAAPAPRAAESAAPQSILGKLFKPQAQHATHAPAASLDAMFERLRRAERPATEPSNTQASAGHAPRAGRLPRS
ncbi:hypothetical protein AWB70_03764 [Caballeronia cordobensis]|uniref:Cellulose biosynthesis protein BcsR n=1 Tax=Caballeronia cordobensis TaxID=1353886 RepID=A0A158HTN6_CABCO|nr:cellulose biosynthesis protein BcsP [Caballeronia cordobensis]SAL47487.1 hypothetical protein AWB70_03764 [Caballeronia cordobensis]